MFLEIEHRLALRYDGYIRESFIELRLQPKTNARQAVASFVLMAGPPCRVHRYRDWNDNLVHHLAITKFHDRIEVRARSLVDTSPSGPGLDAVADATPLAGLPPELHDLLLLDGPLLASPALGAFARGLEVPRGLALGAQVRAVSEHIRRHVKYRKNVTRFDSTTDDVLSLRAGVCQDFAHLMLALLRRRGIPCRYVSGYMHVETTNDEPAQSHAWIEFHSPVHGWVPFDPTHHREIDERYIVVGHGRHYDDVPPNKGIYRGSAREALVAEVRSRQVPRRPVEDLHEEIRAIDLPVYQEIPERPPERAVVLVDQEAVVQQQQQQQQ
jgi:transglutaminase-like putative cysteine protease